MTETNNNPFRERFTEIGAGLKKEEINPTALPSIEGLKLDTKFDLAQLEGFAGPSTDIRGVADKVKPVGIGDLRIDTDLGKLDEGIQKIQKQKINEKIRNWIEEAQKLIAKQKFRPAIIPLKKALAADPSSAIALFLKGYCLFGLQEYYPALEVLDIARQHARDPETIVLILILQTACVRDATERIENQVAELIEKKHFDKAIALIEGELHRQPSNVALLYHKCNVLLLAGKVQKAKQTIIDAMGRVGEENAELFQELLEQITLQDYQRYLEAARVALRRGDPAGALKQLQPCRTALDGYEQYEAIRSYANERSPRGFFRAIFSRDKTIIPLTDASRQKLLLWLLSEELNAGVAAMSKEKFDMAAVSFADAAKIDPGCRIICYLHGLSIFNGFQQVLERQKGVRNLDSSIKSMETASELLARVSTDPLVGQQSTNLRKLVDNFLSKLHEVARERDREEAEAKPVNELIRDFNALMESAGKSPIASTKDLESAERRFRELRQRGEKVRKNRTKEQGLEVVDQIISAIDRNLNQLNTIRNDVRQNEEVKNCLDSFNAMMQSLNNNPIYNSYDLRQAKDKVNNLDFKVAKARSGLKRGSEGLKILNQLEEAIKNVKRQLNQ